MQGGGMKYALYLAAGHTAGKTAAAGGYLSYLRYLYAEK